MAALLTALTITDKPADLGGPITAFCTLGQEREIIDVKAAAATDVQLHRWNNDTQEWVPSASGTAAIAGTATTETRWDCGGARGRYVMVSAGVAGVWYPIPGSIQ